MSANTAPSGRPVTDLPGRKRRSRRDRGYAVVAEAATDVIADEQVRGVEEPWRSESFLDTIVRL